MPQDVGQAAQPDGQVVEGAGPRNLRKDASQINRYSNLNAYHTEGTARRILGIGEQWRSLVGISSKRRTVQRVHLFRRT